MASKIYLQHYADKTSKKVSRIKKQGRPPKGAELKIAHRVTINFTESQYQKAMSRTHGLKLKEFGNIAMCEFDMQLFVQKIV